MKRALIYGMMPITLDTSLSVSTQHQRAKYVQPETTAVCTQEREFRAQRGFALSILRRWR